jgi:hypothetical protein
MPGASCYGAPAGGIASTVMWATIARSDQPLTLTVKPFGVSRGPSALDPARLALWGGGIARIETLPKGADRNAEALAAEVFAVKAVVGQVLGRIHQLDPVLAEAIEGGLEDAKEVICATATRARKGTSASKVVKAIATLEFLREAVLTRSRIPVRRVTANDNR